MNQKRDIEKGCRVTSFKTGRSGIVQAHTGAILFCEDEVTGHQMVIRESEAILRYRLFVWHVENSHALIILDTTVERARQQVRDMSGNLNLDGKPSGILETDKVGGAYFPFSG